MAIHEVQQGEYLALIAMRYGFSDWNFIYDHPNNAALKQRRPNPNVLYPGDQLFIPDKQNKDVGGATEQSHRFQINQPTTLLQIVLKDNEGNALDNLPYTIEVNGVERYSQTNGQGLLQEEIPVGTQTATISLDDRGISWVVQIGNLDPVDEAVVDQEIISGIQARLNNLGYFCGEVDGIFGPKTEAAMKLFQQAVLGRNKPDGKPDKDTRDALVSQHGS